MSKASTVLRYICIDEAWWFSRSFRSFSVALSIQRLLLWLRRDLKVVWVTLVGWRNSKLGRPEGHINIINYWLLMKRWGASMFQERHDKYWHSKPAVKHSKYHTTELLGLNGFRWFRSCAMESHSSCVPRLLLPKVLRRHGIDIGKIWARCSTEVGRLLWWFTKTLGWDAPPAESPLFHFWYGSPSTFIWLPLLHIVTGRRHMPNFVLFQQCWFNPTWNPLHAWSWPACCEEVYPKTTACSRYP